MNLFAKFTSRRRIRKAVQRLGLDPTAQNYATLAREHVVAGNMTEVLRVCTEGLETNPGNAELTRLSQRARRLMLNGRLRVLQRDLLISPRRALWRELIELYIESEQAERAEEVAQDWYAKTKDGEAMFYRARARGELFFSTRRAKDGRLAFDLSEQAVQELRTDPRPLQLQFEIARRVGAWHDARTAIARLLELMPGNPDLELRFRAVQSNYAQSKPLDRALAIIERTGEFVDDLDEDSTMPENFAVRPILQELGLDPTVRAAAYLRGSTALVQGPHGPTADRTARMMREVLKASRNAARRMGLGMPSEVIAEGDFGSLMVSLGEHGNSSIWCDGQVKKAHREVLTTMSGMAVKGSTA